MNSQDFRNLQEAYLNVYQDLDEAVYGGEPKKAEEPKDTRLVVTNADKKGNTPAYQNFKKGDKRYRAADHMDEATAMAKRGLDEPAIRKEIANKTGASGAGSFADKATALADRQTYGDNKKKEGREKLARKQRGDFRNTTSSSPGLRGYGHQSSDPAVKAKQDARGAQRGRAALTPNERKQLNMEFDFYDLVLSHLLDEGYADTNENALVIMVNMSEEWRESIVEVTGRGKIDPIGDAAGYGAGIGERDSRTPKDAGLEISPLRRAEKKVKALQSRNDPDATKRANRINSRFVKPTQRALQRSMFAATNQKIATRKRMQNQDQA